MSTQKITIELPASLLQQLRRVAEVTHQSLDIVITQSLSGNLPPSVDHVEVEQQAELLAMQTFTVDQLQAIAHATIPIDQQHRHEFLLEKNQQSALAEDERQELTQLRAKVDQLMLKKAYAWAVLKWRGERILPLEEVVLG